MEAITQAITQVYTQEFDALKKENEELKKNIEELTQASRKDPKRVAAGIKAAETRRFNEMQSNEMKSNMINQIINTKKINKLFIM